MLVQVNDITAPGILGDGTPKKLEMQVFACYGKGSVIYAILWPAIIEKTDKEPKADLVRVSLAVCPQS